MPLPPSTGSPGRYKATCNIGFTVDDGPASCAVTLKASVSTITDYLYYCTDGGLGGEPDCAGLENASCVPTGRHAGRCLGGFNDASGKFHCTEPGEPVTELTCSAPVAGFAPISVMARNVVTTRRDDSQCAGLASEPDCASPVETCTDSNPVKRTIDGVAVTQPCWAWQRDYQCTRYSPAEDCSALAATPGCREESQTCITEEAPCRTYERVYDCPLPATQGSANQFVCDGDKCRRYPR